MKINELNTTSSKDAPSELVGRRIISETHGESLADFLKAFDFDSEPEIYEAVRWLANRLTEENYMTIKENRKATSVDVLYKRAMRLRVNNTLDKFASNVAAECWQRYFLPTIRRELVASMFCGQPVEAEYRKAAAEMAETYNLTAADVEKFRFFVCQTKAGEAFEKSLRRMLYVWGKRKKTGKTTLAEAMVAVLNGERTPGAVPTSSLSREMQIDNYAVPVIATYRCCVLDEAFYRDMKKTYSRFKAMMTATSGTARLPYGQTFTWNGCPNYIATSNDSLQKFIEDYNDRRFLAVEFTATPKELTEGELFDLVYRFCFHAAPPEGKTWREWASDIAATADEIGARGLKVQDWRVFFDDPEWLSVLEAEQPTSDAANNTRLTRLGLLKRVARCFGDNQIKNLDGDEICLAFAEKYGDMPNGRWWSIRHCKRIDGQAVGQDHDQETTDPFNM